MLTCSMTTFEQPELMTLHKVCPICPVYAYRMMTFKFFDTIWDPALLAASEIPAENVLEGLYKSKLQDSVQLHIVLAMYEPSRLKTSVRHHIDQTMRTRNLRAQNEIVERGAGTKCQKGRKVSVERNVGAAVSGKQLDSFQKETHVVSVMIQRLETDAIIDKKDTRLHLQQKRKHRLMERNHQKIQAAEDRVLEQYGEELSKSVNLKNAITVRQNLRRGHFRKPCNKKDAPAERCAALYSLTEARVTPAPTSKSPEEREFVVDSGSSVHMMSKKDLSIAEMDTQMEILWRSRNPTTVVTANHLVKWLRVLL